jgi:hypothetical protein
MRKVLRPAMQGVANRTVGLFATFAP